MKVSVDQMKCQTAGMCVKICPDVFRFQEGSKRAAAIFGEVPASLQTKCREAARKCPSKAIEVAD